MKIDLSKITNPIVRRALESRARDFMFIYAEGGHFDYTETNWQGVDTHTDYRTSHDNSYHNRGEKHSDHQY